MKIYNYDDNGFFIGSSEADESPLEQGVFLVPRNATEIVPPAIGDGQAVKFENGCWIVVEASKEELSTPEEKDLASMVRQQRNGLLYASDWSMLADAPLSADQVSLWKKYRQALRDVTEQSGFPTEINWPETPK